MAESQGRRRGQGGERGARGTLWVETPQGRLRPIQVRTGLSDGQFTQILGDRLSPEDKVVVRVSESAS